MSAREDSCSLGGDGFFVYETVSRDMAMNRSEIAEEGVAGV